MDKLRNSLPNLCKKSEYLTPMAKDDVLYQLVELPKEMEATTKQASATRGAERGSK